MSGTTATAAHGVGSHGDAAQVDATSSQGRTAAVGALDIVFGQLATGLETAHKRAVEAHAAAVDELRHEKESLQAQNDQLAMRVRFLEERLQDLDPNGSGKNLSRSATTAAATGTGTIGTIKKKSKLDKEVSLICKELAEWLAGPTTAVSDAAKVVSSVLERLQKYVHDPSAAATNSDASSTGSVEAPTPVAVSAISVKPAKEKESSSFASKKGTAKVKRHKDASDVADVSRRNSVETSRRRSSSVGEQSRRSVSMLVLDTKGTKLGVPEQVEILPAAIVASNRAVDDNVSTSSLIAIPDSDSAAVIETAHIVVVDPNEQREKAARVIQRTWRYFSVRTHFKQMISNLQKVRRSSAPRPTSSRRPSTALLSDERRQSSSVLLNIQDQLLIQGIYMFNTSPKKGLKFLIENKGLPDDDERVAEFLLHEKRLNKAKVGEFLGLGEEYSERVKECFVGQIDFSNLSFELAFRKFLSDCNFRSPGEAQKIDRFVETFAHNFMEQNPGGIIANTDACYVLAYSTIMLNTDAHNPNVKKHMSLPEFIKNNRGINNSQDFPEDFLRTLYISIVNNEIKIKDDEMCVRVLDGIEGAYGVPGLQAKFCEPYRRYIREFEAKEIPDQQYFQASPNLIKPERRVIVFSDLLLIIRPSKQKKKNELRHLIHFIRIKISDPKDTPGHNNLVELINTEGRLITLSFTTEEDKSLFISTLKPLIREVSALNPTLYHDKLIDLHLVSTTLSKVYVLDRSTFSKRVGELFRAKPSPVSQQSFDGTSMRSFGAIPSSIVIDSIKSTPGVNDSPTLDGLASSPLPVSSPVASSFATPDIYDRDSEEIPLSPPQIALAHPEEEVPSSPPQIVNNLITRQQRSHSVNAPSRFEPSSQQ